MEVSEVKRVLLKVEHLTKQYGDKSVLKDVSFSVHEGEVVVILGPSGCGKSTLLRCINALEPIQGGTISLDGVQVNGQSGKQLAQLRQKIGMVFQSYELFPHLTVLDNLTLAPQRVQKVPRAQAEAQALEWLERVGLADRSGDYPRQLSGGQKQRVAIVRSLMMHPDVLLFDEVTAALDPEMVREVLDVMLSLAAQGRTMLIVTHEMSFARAVADRIFFVDSGCILEDAPPEQFFSHPQTERARKFLNTFTFQAIKNKHSNHLEEI